ncbi:TPA: hypothetical protein EYG84_01850 [Candidatus Gracilibacteria bacterium]|nr:hypothetical protein [Candidatus Gracilibacteria bacterium]
MSKKVFLCGIGGNGMSALARYFLSENYEVFGSDIEDSAITDNLKKEGITFFNEQKSENITENNFDLFIYTEAIPETNPEFLAAKNKKIETKKYFEMIGEISKNYYTIAVSGSHGKSSTASMLATILRDSEKEVISIVGANIHDWGGKNFMKANEGASDGMPTKKYFVVEACEYRDSFLNIEPNSIVVTNTDPDHLDYFETEENYFASFKKFLTKLPQFGSFISFLQGENIMKILPENFHPRKYGAENSIDEVPTLQVLGSFQKLNAACAIEAAKALKISEKDAIASLEKYKGLARRFDIVAKVGNITIINDYAHHPTSLKMAIHSAREYVKANKLKKLWVVFQPHQYSRTRSFESKFITVFKEADEVLIPNIFESRDTQDDILKFDIQEFVTKIEADMTYVEKKRSNVWGRGPKKRGQIFYKKQARFTNGFENTLKILDDYAYDGDVVLVIGAGDVHKISEAFIDSKS